MLPVSDEFLLNMAEVSASLIGLFLVGVFFYVERGFRELARGREAVTPYFRAGARIVLVLFAIPLGLPLTLIVLEPVWNRVIFLILSLMLIMTNFQTAARVRAVWNYTRSTAMLFNEVAGTIGVAVLVVIPWVLGGFHPTREDFTWAILLAFATGFLSICALVLSTFDIARAGDSIRTDNET